MYIGKTLHEIIQLEDGAGVDARICKQIIELLIKAEQESDQYNKQWVRCQALLIEAYLQIESLRAQLKASDGSPSELEMHRADHKAVKEAGFESVGELLASYKVLDEKLKAAREQEPVGEVYKCSETGTGIDVAIYSTIPEGTTKIYASPIPAQPWHFDDFAVDRFAEVMKKKLAKCREKGRGGWQNPALCKVDDLAKMLVAHIQKGDPVDVANFAMMLFSRDGGSEALKSVAQLAKPVYDAEEIDTLVRRLDVALNGEEGAAKQAMLCDIVSQVETTKFSPVASPAVAVPDCEFNDETDNHHSAMSIDEDASLAEELQHRKTDEYKNSEKRLSPSNCITEQDAFKTLMRDICEAEATNSDRSVTIDYDWLYSRIQEAFESLSFSANGDVFKSIQKQPSPVVAVPEPTAHIWYEPNHERYQCSVCEGSAREISEINHLNECFATSPPITEQDAREIAESFQFWSDYHFIEDMFVNWLDEEGRGLLNKLNAKKEIDSDDARGE